MATLAERKSISSSLMVSIYGFDGVFFTFDLVDFLLDITCQNKGDVIMGPILDFSHGAGKRAGEMDAFFSSTRLQL